MIEFHLVGNVGNQRWVALGQRLVDDGGRLMVCIFFAVLCTLPNLHTEFKGLFQCIYAEPMVVWRLFWKTIASRHSKH